jgi:hypothetical protein
VTPDPPVPPPGAGRDGWDHSRLGDLDGARIWTGQGVFAHNLVKIATLAA